MNTLPAAQALRSTPLGAAVLQHLAAQLDSARRLLDCVLRQGQAIRARDVDAVLARLAEIQGEMERRARLERERTQLLQHAGQLLGIPAHAVALPALTGLLAPAEGDLATRSSAELRGLLGQIAREHQTNRVLMRQELAFLDHLTRMLGAGGDEVQSYRPPAGLGAAGRFGGAAGTPSSALRSLNLEA